MDKAFFSINVDWKGTRVSNINVTSLSGTYKSNYVYSSIGISQFMPLSIPVLRFVSALLVCCGVSSSLMALLSAILGALKQPQFSSLIVLNDLSASLLDYR